ncbi:hypothetical protein M885DRAFT_513269 [Pelagophyceae sp. CCMP2097]|nr:hypothetical protein M885DRAFT_513269 [Pelagophyceae sp. CCMP2097]
MVKRERELTLEFHAKGCVTDEVTRVRLPVDSETTWAGVLHEAQRATQFEVAFALESENGAIDTGTTPLQWIKEDRQGRPWRVVRAVRVGDARDLEWFHKDMAATTHVGLVENLLNAGVAVTTMLSESIENSVQHFATFVQVTVDPENRRITIFDDGHGIAPDEIEVMAKAGASTVRDADCAASIEGALRVSNSDRSTPAVQLGAPWGRYGIGRFSQLNGSRARVRYVSVSKNVAKVVVFEQDMAVMQHRTEVVYTPRTVDAAHPDASALLDEVHAATKGATGSARLTDDFGASRVEEAHFTFIQIEAVDEKFFEAWKRDRSELLAALGEKYVLHLVGEAGHSARSFLARAGVLDADFTDARLNKIIIDGRDLASIEDEDRRDVPNVVRQTLEFAACREDAASLQHVQHYAITESDVDTANEAPLKRVKRARAEMDVLTLYFPVRNGHEERPAGTPSTLIFWNGLYMREERLEPWFLRMDERKATLESLRLARTIHLIFLTSTRFFAPEIHKKHLRLDDPGYALLSAPQKPDAQHRKLRADFRDRVTSWATFDSEEVYPKSDGDQLEQLSNNTFWRVCQVAIVRSQKYSVQDYVRFATTDKEHAKQGALKLKAAKAAAQAPASGKKKAVAAAGDGVGYGRIVKMYCTERSSLDDPPTTGFVVLASPLVVPLDRDTTGAQHRDVVGVVENVERMRKTPLNEWWKWAYYTCDSALLLGVAKAIDAGNAAANRFPSRVCLLKAENDTRTQIVPLSDRERAADPFKNWTNVTHAHAPTPAFGFSVFSFAGKKHALTAGFSLQLERALVPEDAASPLAWEAMPDVLATGPDAATGEVVLRCTSDFAENGIWHFRAKLQKLPGSIWTRLFDHEVAQQSDANLKRLKYTLKDLCDQPGAKAHEVPTSRSIEMKVVASEPSQITIQETVHVTLGGDVSGLVLSFIDIFDDELCGHNAVKVCDYDVRAAQSKCWLEIDEEKLEIDLSCAKLEVRRAPQRHLVVVGATAPDEAALVFKRGLAPFEGKVHIQLAPAMDGPERATWSLHGYTVRDGATPAARMYGDGEKEYTSMQDLTRACNALKRWIVPRTTDAAYALVTAVPKALRLVADSRCGILGEVPLTPRVAVTCLFELVSEHGMPIKMTPSSEFAFTVHDASVEVHLSKSVNLDDQGRYRDTVTLMAPYSWKGRVTFSVGDVDLNVDLSTTSRTLVVAWATQQDGDEVDVDHLNYDTLEANAAGALALPPMAVSQLGATALQFCVVDPQDEATDEKLDATLSIHARFQGDAALVKFGQKVKLDKGCAVVSLEPLTKETKVAKLVKAARGCTLVVSVRGRDDEVLFEERLGVSLVADSLATFHLQPESSSLAVGVPASACVLELKDAAGLKMTPKDAPDLQFSLVCEDEHVELINAPQGASAAHGHGWALPGGWVVRRAFSEHTEHFSTVIKVVEATTRLEASFELELLPGPFRELRFLTVDGATPGQVEVEHCRTFAAAWTLRDVCGNSTDREDGADFSLSLQGDEADLFQVFAQVKAGKKQKRPDGRQSVKATVVEGTLDFGEISIRLKAGAPLRHPTTLRLRPCANAGDADHDALDVRVSPNRAVFELRAARRRLGGLALFPATDDDDIEGEGIQSGQTIQVRTGESPLNELEFRAFDEAGRGVDVELLAAALRYSVGGASKTCKWDTLRGESSKVKWFLKSHDQPQALTFAADAHGGIVEAARLQIYIQRVAGRARRLQIEACTSVGNAAETFMIQAWDAGVDEDPLPAVCRVRATISLDDDMFADESHVSTATHADPLVAARLMAPGFASSQSLEFDTMMEDLAVDIYDCTHNSRPVDVSVQAHLTVEAFDAAAGVAGDVKDLVRHVCNEASVAFKDLGRRRLTFADAEEAARAAEVAREKRAAAERRTLLVNERRRVQADLEALEGRRRDRRKKGAAQQRAKDDVCSKLEAAQAELRRLDEAPRSAAPRQARLSTTPRVHDQMDLLRVRLKGKLGAGYVGFLSDLATVVDDAHAKAIAVVCGVNRLYVRDFTASHQVRTIVEQFNRQGHGNRVSLKITNMEQMNQQRLQPNQIDKRTGAFVVRDLRTTPDRAALPAVNLLCLVGENAAALDVRRLVVINALGVKSSEGPLIFETAAELRAAEGLRGSQPAHFTRIPCDDVTYIIRPGGQMTAGDDPNRGAAFQFAAPDVAGDRRAEAAKHESELAARLEELRQDTDDESDAEDAVAVITAKKRRIQDIDAEVENQAPDRRGKSTAKKRPREAAQGPTTPDRCSL